MSGGERTMMAKAWTIPVAVAAGAASLVAVLGGTMTDLGPWYAGLEQPDWAPPRAAFGIIWTTIFALIALAAVTAWRSASDNRARDAIVGLFAFNGFLNILWSFLFFRLQRPDWALMEVGVLWLSILALVLMCTRHARLAAIMLLPYFAWVTVAAALNYEVVQLNGPFG